jgi:hypothetical protein
MHLQPARHPGRLILADFPDEQLIEPDGRDEQRSPDQEQVDVEQEQADLVADRERVPGNVVDGIDEDGGPVDERAERRQHQNGDRDDRQPQRASQHPLDACFQRACCSPRYRPVRRRRGRLGLGFVRHVTFCRS